MNRLSALQKRYGSTYLKIIEKMNRQALIAFDLDDTLYLERDYLASGHRAVADVLSEDTGMDSRILNSIISASHPKGIEAAVAYLKLAGHPTDISIDELVGLYRKHKPDISLTAETAGALARLKANGHRLAIITDGDSTTQRDKIAALGLYRFVGPEAIIISGETGADKRTPVPFMIAEKLAEECHVRVYIGDNPAKDFIQPNVRGWDTYMLLGSARNVFSQNMLPFPPVFRPGTVIDSLSRLPY